MKEKLTVLIFKDHLTSRSLNTSIQWIKRVGVLSFFVTFLTIALGILFAVSYYQHLNSPAQQSIEQAKILKEELAQLQDSYDRLKAELDPPSSSPSAPTSSLHSGYFSALPLTSVPSKLPPRDQLPFRLSPIKAQWKGNELSISTAIEYYKEDGGNQQGHFVIFIRGPGLLMAYPRQALQAAGAETLTSPQQGEYFSVSRYREVNAQFGPFKNRSEIKSIEFFIFNSAKRLVYLEESEIQPPAAPPISQPTPSLKSSLEPSPSPSPLESHDLSE